MSIHQRNLRRALATGSLLILLAGCGSDSSTSARINLNGHAVIWSGPADADPDLKERFDATVVCLQQNVLPTRRGYPHVVVIDGVFLCNGVAAEGCTELNGFTIYMDKQYLYTRVFNHEVVHWETGMSDAYHDMTQFNLCIES